MLSAAFQWCRGQPKAVSEKTGKTGLRRAYGLHGREMIGWLTQLIMPIPIMQATCVRKKPKRRLVAMLVGEDAM